MKRLISACLITGLFCCTAANAWDINFNTDIPTSYSGSQDATGQVIIEDNGATLYMTGNRWQKIDIGPYTVTANTVIEFDFKSSIPGEIHAVGLDDDNIITSDLSFKIHGSQDWQILSHDNYYLGNGWTHYSIPVGQYIDASTPIMNYLVLGNDDDLNAAADSRFRNVKLHEKPMGYEVGDSQQTLSVFGYLKPSENFRCPAGMVISELYIDANQYVNALQFICSTLRPDGTLDDWIFQPYLPNVPDYFGFALSSYSANYCYQRMITGIRGNSGAWIDNLGGFCSNITQVQDGSYYPGLADPIGGSGGGYSERRCHQGYVMTGAEVSVNQNYQTLSSITPICTRVTQFANQDMDFVADQYEFDHCQNNAAPNCGQLSYQLNIAHYLAYGQLLTEAQFNNHWNSFIAQNQQRYTTEKAFCERMAATFVNQASFQGLVPPALDNVKAEACRWDEQFKSDRRQLLENSSFCDTNNIAQCSFPLLNP